MQPGFTHDPEIRKLPDFDTVMVILKYSDGLICNIDTSRISAYGYDQRIEIFGAKGMAIAENQKDDTVKVYTADGTDESRIKYSFPQRFQESYLAELRNFETAIEGDRAPSVTQEEYLISHVIADAAFESAHHGIEIKFTDFYADRVAE